jgi:hypothetical protein
LLVRESASSRHLTSSNVMVGHDEILRARPDRASPVVRDKRLLRAASGEMTRRAGPILRKHLDSHGHGHHHSPTLTRSAASMACVELRNRRKTRRDRTGSRDVSLPRRCREPTPLPDGQRDASRTAADRPAAKARP